MEDFTIRKKSVTACLIPSHFMILYLNKYHMKKNKKYVFSAPQYSLPMCTCSTGSAFAVVACGQQLLFV